MNLQLQCRLPSQRDLCDGYRALWGSLMSQTRYRLARVRELVQFRSGEGRYLQSRSSQVTL